MLYITVMPKTKVCRRCGGRKRVALFRPESRNTTDGLHSYCQGCEEVQRKRWVRENRDKVRIAAAAWRNSNRERYAELARRYNSKNKDKVIASVKAWRLANPEKRKAHGAVERAVRRGELKRPAKCPRCKTAGRIEAHHADYTKPLTVQWLCKKCHVAEEGRNVCR